jgi:predicted RNA-binding protein
MSRAERFRERIKFEREILKEVNSGISTGSLRGLSKIAIESWYTSISNVSDKKDLEEIVKCLLNISEKMRITATASRDSFELDEKIESLRSEKTSLLILLNAHNPD